MLVGAIEESHESVCGRVLIGIDGCGGAGKSTLAKALCRQLADCQVVPTDDFASWEEPIEWWERMLRQVFLPLYENRQARFPRFPDSACGVRVDVQTPTWDLALWLLAHGEAGFNDLQKGFIVGDTQCVCESLNALLDV